MIPRRWSEEREPTGYREDHELGKRRLAGFLIKWAQKVHVQLRHDRDFRTNHHVKLPEHPWLECSKDPCLVTRMTLQDVLCSEFLEVICELGSRGDRKKNKRARQCVSFALHSHDDEDD